jgi:hypothetical protein
MQEIREEEVKNREASLKRANQRRNNVLKSIYESRKEEDFKLEADISKLGMKFRASS